MHGYKTLFLCVLLLGSFVLLVLVQGHEVTGLEYAAVVGSITALWLGNDVGGAAREWARVPRSGSAPEEDA